MLEEGKRINVLYVDSTTGLYTFKKLSDLAIEGKTILVCETLDKKETVLVNMDNVKSVKLLAEKLKKTKKMAKDTRPCQQYIDPENTIKRGKPAKSRICEYESWKDARCDGCTFKKPIPQKEE